MGSAELIDIYRNAENLTDRLAAMRILVHHRLEGASEALQLFYTRYCKNPLVLDKWFAVQAVIPDPDTLVRVKELAAHPSFSLKNPNRVYALLRSFATANPVGFNRRDGAGHYYLADVILDLDRQNPSVAARLATAFRSFRILETERRTHAVSALRKLRQSERLSRDVSDIVVRTLNG